jgi:hypothetical protein
MLGAILLAVFLWKPLVASESLESGECLILLSGLDPEFHEQTKTLFLAIKENQSVAVEDPSVAGETRGSVSDLSVEKGILRFAINGEGCTLRRTTRIRIVPTFRELDEMKANVRSPRDKGAVETLFGAQKDGVPVEISQSGVAGSWSGVVSDLRVEEGEIVCRLNGRVDGPFVGIVVRRR